MAVGWLHSWPMAPFCHVQVEPATRCRVVECCPTHTLAHLTYSHTLSHNSHTPLHARAQPMNAKEAVKFSSPSSLECTLTLPNAGTTLTASTNGPNSHSVAPTVHRQGDWHGNSKRCHHNRWWWLPRQEHTAQGTYTHCLALLQALTPLITMLPPGARGGCVQPHPW